MPGIKDKVVVIRAAAETNRRRVWDRVESWEDPERTPEVHPQSRAELDKERRFSAPRAQAARRPRDKSELIRRGLPFCSSPGGIRSPNIGRTQGYRDRRKQPTDLGLSETLSIRTRRVDFG